MARTRSRILTGDKMVASVRRRTTVPDDTSSFTDEDILATVDEELRVEVLPTLTEIHAEHLVLTIDVPRNESGVYTIPHRATGNTVRDISLISGTNIYELAQISVGSLPDYSGHVSTLQELDLFYIEGNKVKLVSPTRSYNSIRIRYHLSPNYLTKMEQAGIISSVVKDTVADTLTITLSQVGKNFVSNETYDIIGHKSPNVIKSYDLSPVTLTTGTTGTIVFTLSEVQNADDIVEGDYVSLSEETPVPNIPTEMHSVLAQAAAVQILESLGDFEAMAKAEARLAKMSAATQGLVDDRVELAPKKIKPRNGTLQTRRGRWGFGRNN